MKSTTNNTAFFIFPCGTVLKRSGSLKGIKHNGSRPICIVVHEEIEPYIFHKVLPLLIHQHHRDNIHLVPKEWTDIFYKFIQRIKQ